MNGIKNIGVRRAVMGIAAAACALCAITAGAQGNIVNGLSELNKEYSYVVEIFTSQGCSSCPAADDTISLVQQEAERLGINMQVLAWHVDYWNDLGWVDPYSHAFSNRRQRFYAFRLGNGIIYTPQLLVNGTLEVKNSYSVDVILDTMRSVGAPARAIELDVALEQKDDNTLHVRYEQLPIDVKNARTSYELGVLLLENDIVTTPTRGENRGRRLVNNNIVRAWKFLRLRDSGTISLRVPDDLVPAQSEVVLIAKNLSTRNIEYVTSMGL